MIYACSELDRIDEDMLNEMLYSFPDFRREKVLSYRFFEGRVRSACAYVLACIAVGEVLPSWGVNEYGKPLLSTMPRYFNITHCKSLVAAAVSDYELGLDAEDVREYPQKLVKRVLTIAEQETLNNSENPDITFFSLWTLKESYVKAIGRGLSFPLTSVEFKIEGEISCSDTAWVFNQFLINRCILSACQNSQDKTMILNVLGIEQLLCNWKYLQKISCKREKSML